ncbi:MAG: GNAT family N-acetyltransferase [Deltaproteobacteria bacterium]|jgi:acyl-CoA hydrolase/GNAT superfamily N-acetyltransferase
MGWKEDWKAKEHSAMDAVRRIGRGRHIFIGSGAAEPIALVEALTANAECFSDNPIVHLLTLGPAPYVEERFASNFRHNAYFIGPNVREAVGAGRADYTPVFLSQIPKLITSRRTPVDVALVSVAPPDDNGYVNLGVSVDIVLAAVDAADVVIAEVNPAMPRIHGAGAIPTRLIDAWCTTEHPLPEHPPETLDEVDMEIGKHVASLVPDRATLQMGIGRIPDATLMSLMDRKDLGVWTEMFSDRLIDLVENGNVTGKYKTTDKWRINSSFTFGTQRLYDFIDDNPAFEFRPSDIMNDPGRISRQHMMVAINSALQVDLTGQVSADSIGSKFYSGIGGQVDFIRGASLCPGGKPIIALRSTAKGGTISRIVASLAEGSGVVTSRGDVRYVVTEFGIADLWGRSVRERATALIEIAHPDFRDELLASAKQRKYVFQDQQTGPATAPRGWSRKLETSRGTVRIRLLRRMDERKMQDLFYNLSEETKQKRWMTAMVRLPHEAMEQYLDVDYDRRVAFVVEHTESPDAEPAILAVGRYAGVVGQDDAEVAFVVRDDWQGVGVGTALLERLVAFARSRGLDALTAEVLSTNAKMLRVFHDFGLPIRTKLEEGVIDVRISLEEKRPK